jgi:alpha-tubulin suppressor-like RCC1 family protein
MSRLLLIRNISGVALSLFLIFLSCSKIPSNPYDLSNTKVSLTLESSKGVISPDTLVDSAGNTVKIGITSNAPGNVDSISLMFYTSDGNVETDTLIKNLFLLKNNDTLWFKIAFATKDKRILVATAFAASYKNQTLAYFNILDKPLKPVPHTWPHLAINGITNITAAQTCSLSITANDSNAAQFHSFYVKQDTVPFTQFTPPFKWIPPSGFIGNHPVLFKVTDTDSPAYFDTQTVTITVTASIDTPPKLPHWNKDSINLNGTEGSAISLTLSDISTGDSLSFVLIPGLPAKDTIINAVYSYTFAAFDTNNYYPKIIAKDKNGHADTLTIHLWAAQTNVVDSIGPKITKISGPATNTRTANPNDTLVYSVTDQSGLDTVSWTLNSGAPTGLLPDANGHYTIFAVLSIYHSNKIIITASDKSSSHNKSADTTVLDYNVAPKANNQNLSTKKNTPLSITLTADPIDGDSLSGWTVVTPPVNGTLSGTAPNLTYTPLAGFLGSDSLTFTVSDGKNTSNVAKIKINVSDLIVAPVAGKTIADLAVNKGQPASFAATVNADANPSPVFSWFKEGGSTSISANQTYTISQTGYTDQARYRYVVSNSQGSDTSNWITLTVKDVTKPVIVLKGANPQSIMVGGKYTELGDSAYDDKDGIITSKVAIDTSKVKLAQIGTYSVTYSVKDSAGNVDTITRTVQINGNAPVIGIVSGNKETCINVAAVFSVSATGSQPLKYQWMKGTAAAPGNSTDSTYSITPLSTADAGSFYCVVSNGISPDAQSQNMTLTVDSPPAISSIIASPSTMPVCSGSQVAFTVAATGTSPLTYSWKKNGSAISTAPNSATYTISAVAASDSGQYSCTVSNGCTQSATSSNVHLTITMPPTISAPTANTTISKIVGDTVTLTVTASGTGTLSYQWYKGSTTVGTNSTSLPIKPIAFTDSGAYTCAVSNGCGSATSKIITLSVSSRPTITTQPQSQTLYLNQSATFTVVATGVPQPTYQWRKNGGNITGANNASYTISSPGISDSGKYTVTVTNIAGAVISDTAKFYAGFKSMAVSANHSLILKTDGRLFGCGANTHGQLGDNSTTDRHSPVLITTGVQNMSAGDNHSLILKTDGTLFACGSNNFGQLGDGSTTDRLLPVQIITGVKAISAGGSFSLILMTGGALYACGYNGNGEIGNNTFDNQLSPVQITSGVVSIAAGANFSLIIKTGGTLFAFGGNTYGQLGDGGTANQPIPEQILTGVQSISAGNDFSLILKTDGTMLACGDNWMGQLGDGTIMTTSPTPEQITTNAQSISAGNIFSFILKKDGSLFACGNNGSGQFGDGTTNNQSTPIQITNISNTQSVAAGAAYSLILKTDGTLLACGDNTYGQLGDGTTNNHPAPFNLTFK